MKNLSLEHPWCTVENASPLRLSSEELAARIARDIPARSYVNLGIGQPTLVSNYFSPEQQVVLHTENGMLGMGAQAEGLDIDPDLVNAGKIPVSETSGASYFHQADSFAMMRGGHIDFCVLGAYQVASSGDLANWHTGAPGSIPAVGGAMDLAVGAAQVYVMMSLFTRDGDSKLVEQCTYPLTGAACVDRVYTHEGVFHLCDDKVFVSETFGTNLADLQSRIPCQLWRLEDA